VNTLKREIQDGQLSFRGKRVLELGCGNGLPGIFACLKGASTVHFQDFNAEVLRCLTIPNVYVNLQNARERLGRHCDGPVTPTRTTTLSPDVHFYAGDWGDLHTLLSVVEQDQLGACDINLSFSEDDLFLDRSLSHNSSGVNQETQIDSSHGRQITRTRKLSGSRACERANDMDPSEGGYDIILMAETVYSLVSMRKLYGLIKKCLRPPYGVVYLAAKKHSFCGGGGGTRQFRSIVEENGILGAHLVVEVADGSSNIREIWKFFYK
jgi:predicted nicotinamide N-methyase